MDEQVVGDESSKQSAPRPRRNYPWAMLVFTSLFVVALFLSWWFSWFGRTLSDSQMREYLHDARKPRNVQHALYQISDRMMRGDQAVKQWYPDVVSASNHSSPEVRLLAAWVMGQDNTYEEFHASLLPLLSDQHPGVRHNAALALVRFKDAAARPELVAMLKPVTVLAETAGTVELIISQEGVAVPAGGPLARIKQSDGKVLEVRSPEEARVDLVSVADGATVEAGGALMNLSPSVNQAWEALRALYCIGQPEDIPSIERYTRPLPGMAADIQKQAAATIEAIRGGGVRCF